MRQRRWVVCLCADWCNVCRQYRPVFDALALEHPDIAFEWLDVEDEAETLGDLDVETFPTVLICDGPQVRFYGPVLPQAAALAGLLNGLPDDAPPLPAVAEVAALVERLRAQASG
jgi:thiol-disulfide isomerase/thioredoxin